MRSGANNLHLSLVVFEDCVIFFQCGTSTKVYKDGCLVCLSSKKSYKLCNTCNDVGHSPSECPETWRRYHSTVRKDTALTLDFQTFVS
jgi:protein AIR1/2